MELHLSTHPNDDGNFNEISLDGMETHYVYDDNEIIMEGNSHYDAVNLMLEDGTRAMIVNGTLLTADGQSLILQDESYYTQYSAEDNEEEVVISKEQENQLLQIMTSQNNHSGNQSIIHYIQDDDCGATIKQDANQQILYFQEAVDILPMHPQYQIAELDTLDSNETMQLIKIENDQILQEVEGVIDLEQLLLGQQEGPNVENGNCQYAILKDGQLHLHGINGSITSLSIEESEENRNTQMILDQDSSCNIKGRDIRTGQDFSLSRQINKSGKRVTNNIHSSKRNTNKFNGKPKTTPSFSNLKKLINKKITLGQTAKGKTLVGKIVNVMKKPEVIDNEFKMTHSKRTYAIQKPRNPRRIGITNQLLKDSTEQGIDLINKEESSCQRTDKSWELQIKSTLKERKTLLQPLSNPSGSGATKVQLDLDKKKPNSVLLSQPPTLKSSALETKVKLKNNTANSHNEMNPKCTTTSLPNPTDNAMEKDSKLTQIDQQTTEEPKVHNNDLSAKPSEHSKIIIAKKVVTKDCFNVIARTMSGLMNMESVVKKLKNKTIIVKIIQKIYDQESSKYSKTISYCSGYMVREFKVDDIQDSFSESWSFIPDSNSKETILGEYNVETSLQNAIKMKKFANLTIQITRNPEGYRTTRVLINPPALFQCKACSQSFRTSPLLKMHSLGCAPPDQAQIVPKPIKTTHVDSEKQDGLKKGSMYECVKCNQCFKGAAQIRKHMDTHYKMNMCPICKLELSSVAERNSHMFTHSDSEMPQVLLTALEEEQEINNQSCEKKRFNCHICSKHFSRHSNLQRHIEIHKGEGAMYQCAVCNCCYHYISSLTRHVVSSHVDKSKNPLQNNASNEVETQDNKNNPEESQSFFRNDQIDRLIGLDQMDEKHFEQYLTENFQLEDFQVREDGSKILEIPVKANQILETPFRSNSVAETN